MTPVTRRLRALAKEAMARRVEATARPDSAALVWDAGLAEIRLEKGASPAIVIALLDVVEAAQAATRYRLPVALQDALDRLDGAS